ncbi:hypothetical protein OIU84_009574 [Salix udensis]|uniref:DUF659 domain-containing protein n=1 Tax=Salix udensis TaxID=889485 RepID=A0AAD6JRQ8_9ROSI|nr:hypothetical protein OIU84_009574 [Salix udensis]
MDEWVDGNDRCLVNFLVDCPDGLVYLRSADITDVAGDTVSLQNLLEGVIEEAGRQNVVQVMTCSVTSWMFPVIKQIRRRHMHIFWAVSASDCMGLMLEKIAAVNDIRRVLDEATSLVRFVHNNAAVLEMFRDFTGSERENLFKPAKMRPAIPFLILESILSCKDETERNVHFIGLEILFLVKDSGGQEGSWFGEELFFSGSEQEWHRRQQPHSSVLPTS